MSQKVAARSFILIAFFSFILVLSTVLVVVRQRSYELQTSAIFEEGTGGVGGSSQKIEEAQEFNRDLDGGSQPGSQSGPQQGGSGGSSGGGGGATQPAPPPETCTGTCVVFGCGVSGRKSVSGSCNYGRFCCSSHQVVKVCAVEGDICGTSFGTVCCGGFSCSTSTSGFCRPGGSSEGAIGAVSTECTDAGGQCVSAGSCSAAGLASVNGGAGCALGVCCSKASVAVKLDCRPDGAMADEVFRGSCCSGTYYQPVSGRYVCGVNPNQATASVPTNCLADGTGVSSVDLAGSCCNGALPAASGTGFVCATGGIKVPRIAITDPKCSPNDTRWTSGVTCCSGTIYRRDGQEYCGQAPAYIIDISPGQMCQRLPWAPSGIGKCRCDQRIINMGDICLVNFGATNSSPGRVKACQPPLADCFQVYVCEKNLECKWETVSRTSVGTAWKSDSDIVTTLYNENIVAHRATGGLTITVIENGQERQVKLDTLTPQQFNDLVKSGKVKQSSIDEMVAASLSAQGRIAESSRKEDIMGKIANDPTLSTEEKRLISTAYNTATNPYEIQSQARTFDKTVQGYRDWQNRTEAVIRNCVNGGIDAGTCAVLMTHSTVDFATGGVAVTGTQEIAYQYALCNAEANAGLRPQGCFWETVAAGVSGVFLADAVLSPLGFGAVQAANKLSQAITAIRAGNTRAALIAVFGENTVNKASLAIKYVSEGNFAEAVKTMAGNTTVTNTGLRITVEPNVLSPTGPQPTGGYRVSISDSGGTVKTFLVSGEDYAYLNKILVGGLSREEANLVVLDWVKRKLPYSASMKSQIQQGIKPTKVYAEYDNLTDVLSAIGGGFCDGVACDITSSVTQGILTKGVGKGEGYHLVFIEGKPGKPASHILVYDSINDVFLDAQVGVVDLPTIKSRYPDLDFDTMYVVVPGPEGTVNHIPVTHKDAGK